MNVVLTEGTPWKVIVKYSIPLLGAFILQQLYNTVDMLVMGNFVSQDALSSVGASGNFLGVFITIATGLSSGITVCVANAFGARRYDDVRRYVGSSLLLQLVLGIVISVCAVAIARPVLAHFVKLPEQLVPDAVLYVNVYMMGFVFQMTYNAVAGVLRGLGDSRSSFYFLIVASLLNVVLDILFVAVFHWGVVGVALATTISQAVCALVSSVYLFRNYGLFCPSGKGDVAQSVSRPGMAQTLNAMLSVFVLSKSFDRSKLLDVVRTSFPLMIQAFMLYVGFMLLQRTVNSFGSDMTASYSVVVKVDRYIMAPLIVIFDAMAAYAGQNQGAGRYDRILIGLRQMRVFSIVVAAVFCVVGLVGLPVVVRWFAMNDVATDYAIRNLRMSSIDLFLYALYCPITGMCLGLKRTMVPMVVSFVELTGRNVFARVLAPVVGASCIWWCEPPAWIVVIACVWIYYYCFVKPQLKRLLDACGNDSALAV